MCVSKTKMLLVLFGDCVYHRIHSASHPPKTALHNAHTISQYPYHVHLGPLTFYPLLLKDSEYYIDYSGTAWPNSRFYSLDKSSQDRQHLPLDQAYETE